MVMKENDSYADDQASWLNRSLSSSPAMGFSGLLRNGCLLLLIVLFAWASARFTWAIFSAPEKIIEAKSRTGTIIDQPPEGISPDDAGMITALGEKLASLHLFGETPQGFAAARAVLTSEDLPETSLPLQLRGILATGSGAGGLALIAGKEQPGTATVYGAGDRIPGGAEIFSILPDQVILRRAGKLEALSLFRKIALPQPEGNLPAHSATGQTIQVSRRYVEQLLADMPALAQKIQVYAHNPQNGRPGFRLTGAGNHDFWENVGLRPDDILYEINGMPLSDPGEALRAFEKIRGAREISFVFSRDGVDMSTVLLVR